MAKGRPKLSVRLDEKVIQAVKEAVDKRNNGCNATQEFDVTVYVTKAILEKLDHDKRSRKKRPRRGKGQLQNEFRKIQDARNSAYARLVELQNERFLGGEELLSSEEIEIMMENATREPSTVIPELELALDETGSVV